MLYKCMNCGTIEEGEEWKSQWTLPSGWREVRANDFVIAGDLCDKCEDVALDILSQIKEEYA